MADSEPVRAEAAAGGCEGESVAAEVAAGEAGAAELVAAEVGEETVALAGEREAAAESVAVALAPVEERRDDLERIEGIGPQMSGALLVAGIRTYEQLARTDQATLRRAIEARGLKFAPSLVTWAQQAQLLADGDEEGFADLTRRLVAGRDEGR